MSTQIPPAPSFTFFALQQNRFTWTLTDASGLPVTGATVKATLYADRNLQNVADYPGTPVLGFNNVLLTEAPAGTYSVTIPASFNPPPSVLSFAVIVTAVIGLTTLGTWSTPAVVVPAEGVNDLVRLDDVKQWLSIASTNTGDDRILQLLISGFSQFVINFTGVDSFTAVQHYVETYDGNGATRMFVRNRPIITVNSIIVGAWQIPQSGSPTTPGYFIDMARKSVALRTSGWNWMPPQSIYPYSFLRGQGNIVIDYTAGYKAVPYDLYEACMKAIAINYRRREFIDLISKSLSVQGGAGTTAFRSWLLPPEIMLVLDFYSRNAVV